MTVKKTLKESFNEKVEIGKLLIEHNHPLFSNLNKVSKYEINLEKIFKALLKDINLMINSIIEYYLDNEGKTISKKYAEKILEKKLNIDIQYFKLINKFLNFYKKENEKNELIENFLKNEIEYYIKKFNSENLKTYKFLEKSDNKINQKFIQKINTKTIESNTKTATITLFKENLNKKGYKDNIPIKSYNKDLLNKLKETLNKNKYIKEIEIDKSLIKNNKSLENLISFITFLDNIKINIPNGFALKIRKLGNYKSLGLFFEKNINGFPTVAIELNNITGILHELTHLIDITNKDIYSSKERKDIVEYFKEKLLNNNIKEEYYLNDKEIIARLGEIYFLLKSENIILNDNILLIDEKSIINNKKIYFNYPNLSEEEKNKILNYFDNFYFKLNKNINLNTEEFQKPEIISKKNKIKNIQKEKIKRKESIYKILTKNKKLLEKYKEFLINNYSKEIFYQEFIHNPMIYYSVYINDIVKNTNKIINKELLNLVEPLIKKYIINLELSKNINNYKFSNSIQKSYLLIFYYFFISYMLKNYDIKIENKSILKKNGYIDFSNFKKTDEILDIYILYYSIFLDKNTFKKIFNINVNKKNEINKIYTEIVKLDNEILKCIDKNKNYFKENTYNKIKNLLEEINKINEKGIKISNLEEEKTILT